MFPRLRFGSLALLVVVIGGLMSTLNIIPAQTNDSPRKIEANQLTQEEGSLLRGFVYEGLYTEYGPSARFPRRQVVLHTNIIELHKTKRIATLLLLKDIVKGARPIDARSAAAVAIALEDGPVTGAFLADAPLDLFDRVNSDRPTLRQRLVDRIEKSIVNAEAQRKCADK
jgi:hypothetical protein